MLADHLVIDTEIMYTGLYQAIFCGGCNISNINILRLRQNGWHFPGNICKCIFVNENAWIWNTIPLK